MASPNSDIPAEVARMNIDQLGINYNELPQLPFWAPLLGHTQQVYKQSVAEYVMSASVFTGRGLTQPEKDALAQHYAKSYVIKTWDTPFAVATTLSFYRSTYAKYGFPFWIPKPDKFDPNSFPFPFRPANTPNEISRKLWHGLRLVSWYCVCKVLASTLFLSYSLSIFVGAMNADPRLRGYHEATAARAKQKRRQGSPKSGQEVSPGRPDSQEPASPWASTEQTAQNSQTAWPVVQSSPPEPMQATARDDGAYVFDEASPVAPNEQKTAASQQNVQGSAWDRIRSQARSSASAPGQGSTGQTSAWARKREDDRTSQGAREGTSFSFTSGDEEKSYAKDEAQKDFDEMLERERRGPLSGRR